MKHYPPTIHSGHTDVHFELCIAAHLAKVSETFIHQCEREELITFRVMLHGKKGLSVADVCKLKMIRHLYEDMGLDLEAADFILRYRNRIQTLRRHLKDMKQRMRWQEQAHRIEILAFRRQVGQVSDKD